MNEGTDWIFSQIITLDRTVIQNVLCLTVTSLFTLAWCKDTMLPNSALVAFY